ncbi:MAG: Rieske (2Fe-2S) domain protein, partial [Rhizobacter sp.]|nr:Rieske (2Fe-2S) domain protein [Rhizobacter sp.]
AYGMSAATCNSANAPSWDNGYRQDRALQRAGHFTGLASFSQEDAVCSISGGTIRDRSIEMLSTADMAISRLYRSLLACVRKLREGQEPTGLHADTTRIVGISAPIAATGDWHTLVPGHTVVSSKPAASPARESVAAQ